MFRFQLVPPCGVFTTVWLRLAGGSADAGCAARRSRLVPPCGVFTTVLLRLAGGLSDAGCAERRSRLVYRFRLQYACHVLETLSRDEIVADAGALISRTGSTEGEPGWTARPGLPRSS